ncbi:MAG: iron complex transport system ATP-binding protein [Gammaproteobacteria bacterium]|jgi:iron complex transport system ATP-binding protein
MSLLSTKALSVSIGDLAICTGFDFELQDGEYWGILGGNGIGKTTLLNTLAGLRSSISGEIFIDGKSLKEWKRKSLARKLGMLFQDSVDTFPTTVMETAMIGRYPYLSFLSSEGKDDVEIVKHALGDVALADMANRQVDTLSGGERRRLALATLLVQNPQLWLLDEPTNHLDLHHQITLLSLIIKKVKNNHGALLMVLHDVNLLMRFCSHAMLMIDHNNIVCGPVAEVLSDKNLAELYQHKINKVEINGSSFFFPE